MTKTLCPCVFAIGLVAVGCGKKDEDRGQPADPEADRPGGAPVTVKPAEKPIEPTPAVAKPAPLAPCPAATAITELASSIDISEAGPFDWSQFVIAKALAKDDGKQVRVFIANQDYPIQKMDSLMTPVAAKGDAVLSISLYNGANPVTIGEYHPGKYKDPFTVLAELQVAMGETGAFVGLGINDGVVRVLDLPEGKICGEFEVKSEGSLAKGTFVADVQ